MAGKNPSERDRLAAYRRQIHRQIAMRTIDASVTDATGARPVLVVDEHELVSDVLVKASRTDGSANLFVVMDSGAIFMADLLPKACAIAAHVADSLSEPVHLDAEIGMLVAAASESTRGLNFSVALSKSEVEVRHARQLAEA